MKSYEGTVELDKVADGPTGLLLGLLLVLLSGLRLARRRSSNCPLRWVKRP